MRSPQWNALRRRALVVLLSLRICLYKTQFTEHINQNTLKHNNNTVSGHSDIFLETAKRPTMRLIDVQIQQDYCTVYDGEFVYITLELPAPPGLRLIAIIVLPPISSHYIPLQ